MVNITIGITYYDNYDALQKVIKHYKNFINCNFILVDDGSPIKPLTSDDVPNHWSLYRVTEDIGWNNEGCRNLIAHVCETEWLCLTDMDYVIKQSDINFNDFEKDCIYFFADTDWLKYWLKPSTNNRAELNRILKNGRGPFFDHNQIFTTKKYFWQCGGYDETYIGYYGADGSLITKYNKFNYNISEYEVISVRNEKDEGIGNTNDNRKDLLGRGLKNKWKIPKKEIHNKKLTFPWVKIK